MHRLQDLPPKFQKGSIVTLRGIGKCKVQEVFRVLGYRDFIALVGREMRGLDIPRHMSDMSHKTRLVWFFTHKNTGLRLIDLDNHLLVLITLEFPKET